MVKRDEEMARVVSTNLDSNNDDDDDDDGDAPPGTHDRRPRLVVSRR